MLPIVAVAAAAAKLVKAVSTQSLKSILPAQTLLPPASTVAQDVPRQADCDEGPQAATVSWCVDRT